MNRGKVWNELFAINAITRGGVGLVGGLVMWQACKVCVGGLLF